MLMVAEGIPTALSAWQCAQKLGVEAPITSEVHSVLYLSKPPHEAMWELLGRPPKAEAESCVDSSRFAFAIPKQSR